MPAILRENSMAAKNIFANPTSHPPNKTHFELSRGERIPQSRYIFDCCSLSRITNQANAKTPANVPRKNPKRSNGTDLELLPTAIVKIGVISQIKNAESGITGGLPISDRTDCDFLPGGVEDLRVWS